MADVIVVGGGPAGLSAALFTAKNGLETTVFDTGETWMDLAHLYNYLGVRSLGGEEFMAIARGQTADRGAELVDAEVTDISETEEGFVVETGEGTHESSYVVLATGKDRELAASLGCAFTEEDVVDVDLTMETSVSDAYATGAMVRVEEWQAVIAAGDGGAAGLNILSKEKGERFHDFDTPDDVPTQITAGE